MVSTVTVRDLRNRGGEVLARSSVTMSTRSSIRPFEVVSSEPDAERALPEIGLLDTSAVIWSGRLDVALLPAQTRISAITLAELSVGPLVAETDEERAARQAHLQLAERLEALAFDARTLWRGLRSDRCQAAARREQDKDPCPRHPGRGDCDSARPTALHRQPV
jgi:hypothetical protein